MLANRVFILAFGCCEVLLGGHQVIGIRSNAAVLIVVACVIRITLGVQELLLLILA
jgi:hypothetical protein